MEGTYFRSMTRPSLFNSKDSEIKIKFVKSFQKKCLTDSMIPAIPENISIVALCFVQYSNGRLADVEKIRKAT